MTRAATRATQKSTKPRTEARARGRVIVVGASAGGIAAVGDLLAQLPGDLEAPVLVVVHLGPHSRADLVARALGRHSALSCVVPRDGQAMEPGCVYLAPADRHMLIDGRKILVTTGPRENRFRPAIDALFRSAAASYGAKAIGVVLTGMLEDGSAGLSAIERCGGVAVVQDPSDAEFDPMPRAALANVPRAHRVALAGAGALLTQLARERANKRKKGKARSCPRSVTVEAAIAKRVLRGHDVHAELGIGRAFSCPDCGGVLVQRSETVPSFFRCHAGHAFSGPALLGAHRDKLEETLWVALRMLEERRHMLHALAEDGTEARGSRSAKDLDVHITRIRAILDGTAARQA